MEGARCTGKASFLGPDPILFMYNGAEATWRGIGSLLDRFNPEECANYLVNAGYASA